MFMRHHGWQRPFHPLQMVGVAIYGFLVVAFYTFLGLFLGNRIAEITVTTLFSAVALSVVFLFIRCTAIDPTDKTSFRKKRRSKSKGFANLNYGFILGQIVVRFLRRMERKILRTFIRRKYLDPLKTSTQLEPLLPFPLVMKDDSVAPDLKEDDISFCSLCDFEVKKHSKHCRTCNRCVEGFDHHCRWLNNCVGKRNYTTFILLLIFVLLMLIMEGGTAIAIFIRCFVDKKGIERELERKLYIEFPREVLATISILLVLMTAYGTAAMGQLFFFHVVLIRKGMRTKDSLIEMFKSVRADITLSFNANGTVKENSFDEVKLFSPLEAHRVLGRPATFIYSPAKSLKIVTSANITIFDANIVRRKMLTWINSDGLSKMVSSKSIACISKKQSRRRKQVTTRARRDKLKQLLTKSKIGLIVVEFGLGPPPHQRDALCIAHPDVAMVLSSHSLTQVSQILRRRTSSSSEGSSRQEFWMETHYLKKYGSSNNFRLGICSHALCSYINQQGQCSCTFYSCTVEMFD
ncbi:hypothetical protein EZV62_010189 [Acer yangbiense]|uniref:S-acyltransferase n=1 Tax=Acer yangbiense TaxID=1000413 RepID=A0A5C7I297_9ROSI|nr:hypothetical protein EZV62_010189 [Acer yangbiense]